MLTRRELMGSLAAAAIVRPAWAAKTQGLIERAMAGIDPDQFIDIHTHVVGLGTDDSGCWVNPRMKDLWHHPSDWARFRIYQNASGITQPARGNPVSFPYADFMRLPIHVDDITEVFKRVLMADDPQHAVYNSGGTSVSMGDIAEIVRDLLPDADITFENETGGYEDSSVFLMDNSRLVNEFGLQYRPYPERVLQIINEVRSDEGLPEIST